MRTSLNPWALPLLLAAASVLGGCTEAILGAGAATGVAVAQERSVGDAVDDAGIVVRINAELLRADTELFSHVEVKSVEGRVVLTGTVPKPEQRIEASRIAWSDSGVRQVDNELQVDDKSSVVNYAKDSWITARMRSKILTDTKIADINYTVETVNGVMYLIGIARSQSELDRVVDHARNIGGVVKVVSHVRVKDGAAPQA